MYKAAEVCEVAQLQPFVLRSWEKEFPRIGIQKSADSPRLYRQSDLDQVLHIKRLVFEEGLTLSGARRRIEDSAPESSAATDDEVHPEPPRTPAPKRAAASATRTVAGRSKPREAAKASRHATPAKKKRSRANA